MGKIIVRQIRAFLSFLTKTFWSKPTSEEEPLKATDVSHHFECVNYKGQWINMHKDQLPLWAKASRKKKRETALKAAKDVKQGRIRFELINGKMTCIKNKDYGK